ncbi:MAG TPA: sigma-70 family RNA polymerase sigma factor [Pyrinomonadaceae bacterium]|nr:sigma-70 family RNA polymerase sigma factor [Pyrinomonadaceae bacterium]
MNDDAPNDVTELLFLLSNGETAVLDELLPRIYSELRVLASNYLSREYRKNHTLQPTALVHEAYLRLVNQRESRWESRAHFFGAAANVMRQILVDYARRRTSEKRGGEFEKMQLEESIVIASSEKSFELLALDEALDELAKFDPQKSKIVELRYFGGLSVAETAEVLNVSEITVKRHWRVAKAWLYDKLKTE